MKTEGPQEDAADNGSLPVQSYAEPASVLLVSANQSESTDAYAMGSTSTPLYYPPRFPLN